MDGKRVDPVDAATPATSLNVLPDRMVLTPEEFSDCVARSRAIYEQARKMLTLRRRPHDGE